MALLMQQKASVGRFDGCFGLDLYRFVNELCAKKRKHSIIRHFQSPIVNLTEEWQWLRVSRKLLADAFKSGIIVKV